MKNNKKKTGRPPEFDREQVLEKLLNLFWLQGYEGTSIADIVKTAGINPPTLYASFGTKDQVFSLVIDKYIVAYMVPVMSSIHEPGLSVPARLELFLERFIRVVTQHDHPPGCMFLSELFVYHKTTSEIFDSLRVRSAAFFTDFCTMIEKGIDNHEIHSMGSVLDTAIFILTFEYGLAIQAKSGTQQDTLLNISRRFVSMLSIT